MWELIKTEGCVKGRPAIKVYKIHHDEFLFLGKQHSLQDLYSGAVWDDFCNGGYA